MPLSVLVGGTFDPPHIGHLLLAECARVQLDAARVIFLPAGQPWRKAHREVSEPHHRLAMTRLAIRDHLPFQVDDREVRRRGPTYTVDTLESFHAEGRRELALILGADALADMPNWHDYRRIPELASIAVALKGRDPATLPALAAAAGLGEVPEVIDMPDLPISSTLIRQRVAEGKPVRYLIPLAVETYIRDNGLYAPPARTVHREGPLI